MKTAKSAPVLDHFDVRILNVVQENNLLTSERLGEKVGLSATASRRRLRRLRAEGIISADVSLVSAEAAGTPVTCIVMVSLEREQRNLLEGFSRRIKTYPEVTQSYYVTGDADFILVVRVPTMEDYGTFTERAFFGDKNVRSFQTYVAMRTDKFATKFHIEE